jgi:hypothetical protein
MLLSAFVLVVTLFVGAGFGQKTMYDFDIGDSVEIDCGIGYEYNGVKGVVVAQSTTKDYAGNFSIYKTPLKDIDTKKIYTVLSKEDVRVIDKFHSTQLFLFESKCLKYKKE